MKAAIENHTLPGCIRQAELRFAPSAVGSSKATRLNDSMKTGVLQTFIMILFLTAAFRVTAQQTWGALGSGFSGGYVEALQILGGSFMQAAASVALFPSGTVRAGLALAPRAAPAGQSRPWRESMASSMSAVNLAARTRF